MTAVDILNSACAKTQSSKPAVDEIRKWDLAAICRNGDLPEEAPLTDSQMGIYLECAQSGPTTMYNCAFEWSYPKADVSAKRLADAVERVVASFVIFEVQIQERHGIPCMVRGKEFRPEVERLSVDPVDYAAYRKDFVRPFTLGSGALFRFSVVEAGANVSLLIDAHHMVCDGTSIRVLSRAITQTYDGLAIAPEQATMLHESAFEQAWLADDDEVARVEELYGYWEHYLDGADSGMGLAADRGVESPGRARSVIDTILCSRPVDVERYVRTRSLTESTLFIGAFSYVLGLICGQKDVLFTTVNHGRGDQLLRDTVGMFVRTLPMRVSYRETEPVESFLARVQANLYAGIAHEEASFSELVRRFGVSSNVSFVYQGRILDGAELGGTSGVMSPLDLREAMDDLQVMVSRQQDDYRLMVYYRTDLYTDELVWSVVDLYEQVVSQMLMAGRLEDIELVGKDALRLIDRFNATETEVKEWVSPVDRVRERARRCPEKIAVTYGTKTVAYGELLDQALRLAGELSRCGVGRGDFVPVLVPRNEQMVICALGVTLSGAAYEPLDPTYPSDRIAFMMSDAGARVIVADRGLHEAVEDASVPVIYADTVASLPRTQPEERLEVSPEEAILMLYTSGTTGKPKGAILTHGNIDALVRGHWRVMDMGSDSVYATYASFGFDAAVMDIWSTLCAGARLVIVPDEIRLDLPSIDALFAQEGVTHAFMTTQVARMFTLMTEAPTLAHLMLGGERVIPFVPPRGLDVINAYGPSETTAYVTYHRIADGSDFQPIGQATDDTKLYVVDELGRLLPPGMPGELWVAGPHVCRGYINRPEKNAEAFIANPFDDKPGYDRVYRTGDVVRLLPTGEYDFVGRADSQVKIRGFRIELTEIEHVLLDFPGVSDVAVRAIDMATGGKSLVAYVACSEEIDEAALRAFVAQRKPPYMVPSAIVTLDAIPRNSRNKVDWRRLPEPHVAPTEVVEPRTQRQEELLSFAKEMLGTEEVGITTDLFDAGMTSISSMWLCAEIDEHFHVPIRMRDLRTHPTVEKLDALIGQIVGEEGPEEGSAPCFYPLTKTQEGIYVECLAAPGSTSYNIPALFELDAAVDLSRLRECIARAVRVHPMLQARLCMGSDGKPRLQKDDSFTFAAKDVSVVRATSLEEIRDGLVTPFELMGGALFRATIIEADINYLFIEVHHIIADGASLAVLLEDVSRAYAGSELEPERLTGFEVSLEEERLRQGPELEEAKRHYENLLAGVDADYLPNRDKNPSDEGAAHLGFHGSEDAAFKAKEFCDEHGLTLNGMLNAAFGLVLARFNASSSSVFCTIYNGRNDPRLARTVSMLVKTLPVVVSGFEASPAELARNIGKQLLGSMDNDLFSFAEISSEYDVRPDVMFIYQGKTYDLDELCGRPATLVPIDVQDEKVPLSIEVLLEDGRFRYRAEYDAGCYTQDFVQEILCALDTCITEFPVRKSVEEVSLIGRDARKRLDAINATEATYDEAATITGLFRQNVAQRPEAPAVVYGDVCLSYSALYGRACRLARRLIELGLVHGGFVPVLIERSDWMPVCALGVALAGGAYEPLDPTYPTERLSFMAGDVSARILVADRSLKGLLPEFDGDVIYLDEIADLPLPNDDSDLAKRVPSDPLVVLYTSGTTGTPKGLVLTEGNLVALTLNQSRIVEMGPEDVCATYASYGFDCCQMDIFCTLAIGACLLVVPTEMRLDMAEMDELLTRERATHMFATTQIARMFAQMTKCPTLRYTGGGGEKLVPFAPSKGLSYVNMYGPSECSVYLSAHRVTDGGPFQPLGPLNANVKAYVLDVDGNLLPPGAAGELCIAGPQVTPGYLNRPEKNVEAFLPNKWCENPAYDRLYRTGDIVRILPSGELDYIGRRDGLVKVRGFRIELTEVESSLLSFPGVEAATVQAFDAASGGKFLSAYVVGPDAIDLDALREHVAGQKPPYMVPAVLTQIDSIPRTVNGKVDKRALPVPDLQGHATGAAPTNESEETVCDVFREVLGLEQVFADDDFFAIGGTSILAVQAVVICGERGLEVTYADLFAHPTAQSLAKYYRDAHASLSGQEGTAGGGIGDTGSEAQGSAHAPTNEEPTKHTSARCEGYDLSALSKNLTGNLPKLRRHDLGDVLLLGATGFLGAHILHELLEATRCHVYCLVRPAQGLAAIDKLSSTLAFYFEDWYVPEMAERVTVVEGSLGTGGLRSRLSGFAFDTIIDVAANVKHFASGDEIVRDNFRTIGEVIDVAEEHGATLVYASTISVSGTSVNASVPFDVRLRERDLDVGQTLDNQYTYAKFLSERSILDAVSRGRIRAKVMRLGNLMPRLADGVFQMNAQSNSCMNLFKACDLLGCFPIDCMDAPMEFSAIEYAARAVVLLAGTNEEFTVFHVKSPRLCHMGDVVRALKARGHEIDLVEDDEFRRRFAAAVSEGVDDAAYTSLVAYLRDGNETLSEAMRYSEGADYDPDQYPPGYRYAVSVSTNDSFSVKALYRLGFAWPMISEEYLSAFIEALEDLCYF